MFRKTKTVKLAQTLQTFKAQADSFLKSEGFPLEDDYRKLYGSFIQMLPPHQDEFEPKKVAAMMRKAIANELAFWTMHPEKLIQKEADDAKRLEKATSEVVQKVS